MCMGSGTLTLGNIGSDDSIEDLAFEQKESWQISNIVARKILQL